MKCNHTGCNGNLVEQPEDKGRTNVFVCDKCGCTLCLTTVKYDPKCPMLGKKKEGMDIQDDFPAIPEKRKRGRPRKNVSNDDVQAVHI
jgi:hypothetical protein